MAVLDDLLKFIAQYQMLIAKQETKAAQALAKRYKAMYARIAPQVEALAEQIATGELSVAEVKKLKSLAALETAIEEEFTAFSGYLRTEINPLAVSAAGIGAEYAYAVMKYLTGGRDINQLSNVEALLQFLKPGSALYERISKLAGYHTENVIQAILDAVGRGLGPRQVAREIMAAAEGAFGGGLVDALRMERTAQLWASRAAGHANYIANQDIVTGWIWIAELDETVCMSCVALHGQRFDLDEVQDDHYNGRCTSIPEIMGQNPIEGMATGADWFSNLTEEQQQQMMGPEKWSAWKDGFFDIKDMSRQQEDAVYGHMRGETPLWELLGAEPPTNKGSTE